MAIPGFKLTLTADEEALALSLLRQYKTIDEVEGLILDARKQATQEAAQRYAYEADLRTKAERAAQDSTTIQAQREAVRGPQTSDPKNGYFVADNPNVDDNHAGLVKTFERGAPRNPFQK